MIFRKILAMLYGNHTNEVFVRMGILRLKQRTVLLPVVDCMQPNRVAQVLTLLGCISVVLGPKMSWETSYNDCFVIFLIPFTAGLVPVFVKDVLFISRSQWPRGLRRGSVAARLLGLCVRIALLSWKSIYCECCVLSDRGFCDKLITHPGESYRVWCFWVWFWSLDKEEAVAC